MEHDIRLLPISLIKIGDRHRKAGVADFATHSRQHQHLASLLTTASRTITLVSRINMTLVMGLSRQSTLIAVSLERRRERTGAATSEPAR